MKKKSTFSAKMVFSERDFRCFEKIHRRSEEYNKYRLKVRRKLGDLGTFLLEKLAAQGIEVVLRTSLHHPYTYNRFSVDSQWAYFAPAPATLKTLKTKLGPVGEDLNLHYAHTLLLVGIQVHGLFVSLKIHPKAWWDGQNLKNKCRSRENRKMFLQLLTNLKQFSLRLDDWPNRHRCDQLGADDISNYFQYYTPGEHWLHLDCDIAKEDPLATGEKFAVFAKDAVLALLPIYSFVRWNAENDHVFRG